MNLETVCRGPEVLVSVLPMELFYLSSLSVYAFFIFFAFFVYRRARGRASGRIAAIAMFLLAAYVGSTILLFDSESPGQHLLIWGFGWIAICFAIPMWKHMTFLIEAEELRPNARRKLSRVQRLIVGAFYGAAAIFAAAAAVLPRGLSDWLFDWESFGPAPWPYCLWSPYWSAPGDYYILFGLFLVSSVSITLGQLIKLAVRAHRVARHEAESDAESRALGRRNQYLWMLIATVLLVIAGVVLVLSVELGIAMPESVGHTFLAIGGLIVGLTISRHDAWVRERNVAPDFYRAASSVGIVFLALVAAAYLGESGEINKVTLVSLVTLAIVFFVNVDWWWGLVDNLFFGPVVAKERAEVRSALHESAVDPDLLSAKVIYQRWGGETRAIFLSLGEGLSRGTISKERSMHISTVDLHIRRIKDSLGVDKMEDLRSMANKLARTLPHSDIPAEVE